MEPIISSDLRPSFTQFKKDSLIHKFSGGQYFVLLYGWGKSGWKYRILLRDGTQDKALRAAYVLLFGEVDEYDREYVTISLDEDRPLKMPLGANFRTAFNLDYHNPDIKTLQLNWI